MLIVKGKCSESTCGKEFNIPDGGFEVSWKHEGDVVRVSIRKAEATTEKDTIYHACGKACLHKLIDQQIDNWEEAKNVQVRNIET